MVVRALLALSLLIAPAEAAIPSGPGNQTATLGEVSLEVATWGPTACTPAGILVVFAGLHRTIGPYRDYATPLAKRYCLIVVAPLLDAERFPSWSYQRGGVVQNGVPLQPDRWTVNLVPRLMLPHVSWPCGTFSGRAGRWHRSTFRSRCRYRANVA
jgi:hypothetical protein